MEYLRIILADRQATVRSAIRLLLEQEESLCVVGEAGSADQLLPQIDCASPDMVLLDWELPGLSGRELLDALLCLRPDIAVIVLSGRPDVRRLALEAGAAAFVTKTEPPDRLLRTVYEQRPKLRGDTKTRPSRPDACLPFVCTSK